MDYRKSFFFFNLIEYNYLYLIFLISKLYYNKCIIIVKNINIHVFRTSIEALEHKLNSWNEFDTLKESCLTWLRETDFKIHAIDLKKSLQEKKSQFEELKVILN